GPTAAGSELPNYPWQRERHWFKRTDEAMALTGPISDHPLLGFRWPHQPQLWSNTVDLERQPWLADHLVEGVPVLPGAATVEIGPGAAGVSCPAGRAIEISDLTIWKAVGLQDQRSMEMRTRLDAEGRLEIDSRPRMGSESWTTHATGRAATVPFEPGPGVEVESAEESGRPVRSIEARELYAAAARLGLDYGPRFRGVTRVEVVGSTQAVVHLDPGAAEQGERDFILDPVLLDGALQGFLALLLQHVPLEEGTTFLPYRFGRILVFEP